MPDQTASTLTTADRPDRPDRQREIGEQSRKRILDAAERLFIERGVGETSFALIQKEAGISRGSIPWHFKNKQGLLLAILERAMIFTKPKNTQTRGARGLRDYFTEMRGHARQPQAALLASLLADSFRETSYARDRYRNYHSQHRELLIELIANTPDDFQLPDGVDIETYVSVLYGAVVGLHMQWRLAPDLVDFEAGMTALEAIAISASAATSGPAEDSTDQDSSAERDD